MRAKEKLHQLKIGLKDMLFSARCRILCPFRRFTILSTNCTAGFIYHRLRLPFQTPTINSRCDGQSLLSLVHHFGSLADASPTLNREKTFECGFPVISIFNATIYYVHGTDAEKELAAWRRRCRRLSTRLIIVAASWDTGSDISFSSIPYPVIFFKRKSETSPAIDLGIVIDVDEKYFQGKDTFLGPAPDEYRRNMETATEVYAIIGRMLHKAYGKSRRRIE